MERFHTCILYQSENISEFHFNNACLTSGFFFGSYEYLNFSRQPIVLRNVTMIIDDNNMIVVEGEKLEYDYVYTGIMGNYDWITYDENFIESHYVHEDDVVEARPLFILPKRKTVATNKFYFRTKPLTSEPCLKIKTPNFVVFRHGRTTNQS